MMPRTGPLIAVIVGVALFAVFSTSAKDGPSQELRAVGDRGPSGDWPPVALGSKAGDPSRLTDAGRLALETLVRTGRFTDEAIGIAGITPLEVVSIRILHREPRAAEAFAELCRRGTPAGRLWGLCGLWYWDPARFHRQVAALLRDHGDTAVETIRGCIVEKRTVRQIVRIEGKGVVRLENRSRTCREWIREHAPDGAARHDIVGGGWPCVFRSGGN